MRAMSRECIGRQTARTGQSLSDVGFARLLNGAVAAPLALGEWGELYLGSDILLQALSG